MEQEEKMLILADLLDVEVSDITPDTRFDEIEWNSVSVLSFIIMMNEEFGKEVSGDEIKNFVTIRDALEFMKK